MLEGRAHCRVEDQHDCFGAFEVGSELRLEAGLAASVPDFQFDLSVLELRVTETESHST